MRFGFVSTRFAGTDGVSLESAKWAEVLKQSGHDIYWFCGLSDRPAEITQVVPEAHFEHPDIIALNETIWEKDTLSTTVNATVEKIRRRLREKIREFIDTRKIDVLVPQNTLTIPMNIPLGLALADIIRETGIPTIAHHHDFYWERDRFTGNATKPWLVEAFPPVLPSIKHVVINSAAKRDLESRFSIGATVIPNVMNFTEAAIASDDYAADLRERIGLLDTDRLILQPTRIIPRKGIELSIELLARLSDERNKLIISHDSGDEGHQYLDSLRQLADSKNVDLRLIGNLISTERTFAVDGSKLYTLEDLYPVADFVTFPSLYEGFGNALLEAIHFGKPLLVNRYSVFIEDIEPVGLNLISIDGSITNESVDDVSKWLEAPPDPARNREIASRHFGYGVLQHRLKDLLESLNK
ncbi:MAG: glycosyltransferase family 4 protein [Verrucomicrobiales bacterium]|nr:glycosyltransferase family 4 protein [Verrucomicrobiales bacterium]